jgi:hypothetical protein
MKCSRPCHHGMADYTRCEECLIEDREQDQLLNPTHETRPQNRKERRAVESTLRRLRGKRS